MTPSGVWHFQAVFGDLTGEVARPHCGAGVLARVLGGACVCLAPSALRPEGARGLSPGVLTPG